MLGKRTALFKSGQWHFPWDNAPVHNSILVTDYLIKMGIKTVPQPPYCPDLDPSDFCLFPKPRGCRYETIEEMKEAVTKFIDALTQEDFDGAFRKLLERYNKCIAAGGYYFEGDLSFMSALSIKVSIRQKSTNLSYTPRIYIYIYIFQVVLFRIKKKKLKLHSLKRSIQDYSKLWRYLGIRKIV